MKQIKLDGRINSGVATLVAQAKSDADNARSKRYAARLDGVARLMDPASRYTTRHG